jgi:hypothetical protein
MARNSRGSQHQAKHFQPDDHEHAAHQEQASHGRGNMPGRHVEKHSKKQAVRTGYPGDSAPKGPRKGQ